MYDFDKITNRRNSGCYKWDEAGMDDIIPMWVADMDFQTAPCIIEALQKRVAHGVFGYTLVPDAYYEAVINWFQRRYSWVIQRDWIQYTSGVVPAISVIIKAMCEPGDKVIVQTPVYNCFFSSIRNNGCEVLNAPLIRRSVASSALAPDASAGGSVADATIPDACPSGTCSSSGPLFTYEMDFVALETQASDPKAKLLILCNPHNPAGRVWTKEELLRVNDICLRHGVLVVSDEIHNELCLDGRKYVPFASVSEDCQRNSITCTSPSKSFNTAGLQIANIICSDASIREKIDRAININEVCDVNPFGVAGLMAAYNEGEEWLTDLCAYLTENYKALRAFFADNLPQLPISHLEGTYLVWVDVSSLEMDADTLVERLLHEAKVQLNSGTMYDPVDGKNFVRMNIACPRQQMMEGLRRISPLLLP
ncbi:MAG: pyridoxal phosphate-dependent aminotransferase, partial [Prevotella sp.]|nr:pyridoxal phosphate-dependent aminotransferase [Prevotella sp.]